MILYKDTNCLRNSIDYQVSGFIIDAVSNYYKKTRILIKRRSYKYSSFNDKYYL